jgi:hypothetical protein
MNDNKKEIGSTITYSEIKESVRKKQSFEFTAMGNKVNINNAEILEYTNITGLISLPPLINKSEIFKTLWSTNANTVSLQWDYIVLLTYLNDGEILYKKIEDDYYLVSITF